jgi:hypothetical protein
MDFNKVAIDVAKKHDIDLKNPTINYIKDIKN